MDREALLHTLRSAIRSDAATVTVARTLSTVPTDTYSDAAARQAALFDGDGKLPATALTGPAGSVLMQWVATGTVEDPLSGADAAASLLRSALDRILADLPDGIDPDTIGHAPVATDDPTVARLVDVALNRRGARRATGDGLHRVSHDRVAMLAALAADEVRLVPQREAYTGWTCVPHVDRSATVTAPDGSVVSIPRPTRANGTPLSDAARSVIASVTDKRQEVNGWEFWQVRMSDGTSVPIDTYLSERAS